MNWVHKLFSGQLAGNPTIDQFKPGAKLFNAVEEIQKNVITEINVNGEAQSVVANSVELDIALSDVIAESTIYSTSGQVSVEIENGAITNWAQGAGYGNDGQVLTISSGTLVVDWLRMV